MVRNVFQNVILIILYQKKMNLVYALIIKANAKNILIYILIQIPKFVAKNVMDI